MDAQIEETQAAQPPNGAALSHEATTSTPTTVERPGDLWETCFIWAFIIRFTDLKGKVEGLENVKE